MKNYKHLIVIFCCLFLFISCASNDTDTETVETESENVSVLYNKAKDALEEERYITAAQLFDDVERQFPYSQWATQAILMSGYAHYKNLSYDEAIITLDRFIDLHPGNKNIAYAFYLRALSFYEQIVDVGRDQSMTESAKEGFEDILRRFPESEYARDARLKLDLINDHLAGKEMDIGRYYLERGHYQAAINRFKIVTQEYDTTSHTPEALHRMVEAFTALGITSEAQRVAAVLGHNYPGSDWYKATYALIKGETIPELQPPSTWQKIKETVTSTVGLD